MTRFDEMLRRLVDGGVEFVLIGGVAAVAQGYNGSTLDFDLCPRFTPENLDRLVAAFRDVGLRFAPPSDRPVTERGADLVAYRFLAWRTDLGRVDVIKEVPPLGTFEAVAAHSDRIELYSRSCLVLGLDGLIAVKEHLSRDKDKLMLPALRALKALRERGGR